MHAKRRVARGRIQDVGPIDAITVEVVRYSLISAARETLRVFKRTATLAILYEMNDFAMAIFDRDLNLIAEASGIPMFCGSLDFAIDAAVKQIGADKLEPFDVVVNNHPHLTGGQAADAVAFEPIFHGDQLIGYVAMRAHMGDCGAINQYPSSSTDMYQEGTILPSLKLFRRGVLDDGVLRVIQVNSRLPLETGGDFIAGAAALNAGRKRVLEIVDKYGLAVVEAAKKQILDHGERLAREAIRKIPDGTYKVVDYLDNNGVDDEPVRIELAVIVKGTDIVVDLSGSAPQQRGPVNCPYPYTVTSARFGLKLITTPDLPTNAGTFRPLTVIAPAGSIFNPTVPAPCWFGFIPGYRVNDLMPLVFADVLPEQIPAPHTGDFPFFLAYIRDPEDRRKIHFAADFGPIGLGGTAHADGASALINGCEAGCTNIPAELTENKMPVLVERYELNNGSGGPGRFRGGLGMRTVWKFLGDGQMTSNKERIKTRLSGLHGGRASPAINGLIVHPGTPQERIVGKVDDIVFSPGDRIILLQAGGAGYGDPLERDPERVLWDVLNDYVSVETARADHGVVIDIDSKQVDVKATTRLRADLRKRRVSEGLSGPEPLVTLKEEIPDSRRTLRIDEISWTSVKQALEDGWRTIVFGVGSHEQHGPHLPLANDSLIGDWLAETVARRLGKALVAPTIRVGCSDHHMPFPGTITLDADTLQSVVIGYCRSLVQHGFNRVVIIPSHGGNFKPVADAIKKLKEIMPSVQVIAYTDLDGIVEALLKASDGFGISRGDSGAHAGEFETSMTLFLRPDLVDMKKAEKGLVGDMTGRLAEIIEHGMIKITPNGIIGDARLADASRGKPYLETWADEIIKEINRTH